MGIDLSVARYLLSAKKCNRNIRSSDLVNQLINAYSFTELLITICDLEREQYIQFNREFWIITEKGIDHFFRLEAEQ